MRRLGSLGGSKASAALVFGGFLFLFSFVLLATQRSSLYAAQQTYRKYRPDSTRFALTPLQLHSKSRIGDAYEWRSILKEGLLTRNEASNEYSLEWKKSTELRSHLNEKGRGVELSELIYFNNELLACDDRTGIIFAIVKDELYPRYILPQGDGNDAKGLKCEWMTVKDDKLLVGSIGKEWTKADGTPVHNQLYWVKEIDREGRIKSRNWTMPFEMIREATGHSYPAYLVHEAVNWDAQNRRWVFMPRRVSSAPYTSEDEELKGANLVIFADEKFGRVEMKRIGPALPTHGFSSFKFIPYRHDEVVALKSVEHGDVVETYLTVFNLSSERVLLPEVRVAENKFEGVEIV